MKLIDRKPTPEMIEGMHERGATLAGMFQAAYDAAPEVKQEPVAIVDANDEGYWADILPDRSVKVGQPLFAYPPDAQAEIAKRDKRIKELEQQIARLKTVPMKYRRMEFNAQLQRENTEQAAEISRLRLVIAELEADQDKANADVAIGNYLGKTYNYAWCNTSLASQTIDLLKEQSAEISRLKSELQDLHKRNYITHSLFETGDTDCPEQAKDSNGEVVLGVCKNCGRIEAELAEPCDRRKEITRLRGVIVDLRFLQNIHSTQEAEIQRLESVSKEAKEAIELFLEQYPHMAKGYLIDALAAIKEEGL